MAPSNDSAARRTPLLAVVGVSDYAVEQFKATLALAAAIQAQLEARVSAVQADVEQRVAGFDPKLVREQAQELPIRAAARALRVAGKAEARFEELAERGRSVAERIWGQASTQELVTQAGHTLSRGRATVTLARHTADEAVAAIMSTIKVGRRESGAVIEGAVVQVERAADEVKAAAAGAETSVRKAAATSQASVRKAAATSQASVRKAAATSQASVRKAAATSQTSVRQAASTGQASVRKAATATKASAREAAETTQDSARTAVTTTRKRAAATTSSAKGVRTSAAKTAAKASAAAKSAAATIGQKPGD